MNKLHRKGNDDVVRSIASHHRIGHLAFVNGVSGRGVGQPRPRARRLRGRHRGGDTWAHPLNTGQWLKTARMPYGCAFSPKGRLAGHEVSISAQACLPADRPSTVHRKYSGCDRSREY